MVLKLIKNERLKALSSACHSLGAASVAGGGLLPLIPANATDTPHLF